MSVSLSEISVDVVTQHLTGLAGVIDKAIAFAAEKKLSQAALIELRFAPDMYNFGKQVQVASFWGAMIAAKLANIEPMKFADDEKSLEDLKARVERALAFVKAANRGAVDAMAETVVSIQAGANVRKYKGKDFALHFALPHFFFHCTTAYDLLRHFGIPLAKRDYMGAVIGLIEG